MIDPINTYSRIPVATRTRKRSETGKSRRSQGARVEWASVTITIGTQSQMNGCIPRVPELKNVAGVPVGPWKIKGRRQKEPCNSLCYLASVSTSSVLPCRFMVSLSLCSAIDPHPQPRFSLRQTLTATFSLHCRVPIAYLTFGYLSTFASLE